MPTKSIAQKQEEKKVLNIGNQLVEYTHIFPTQSTQIKLSFKERVRVMFGSPLILNLNMYLDEGKIVHTAAMLSTLTSLLKEQAKNTKQSLNNQQQQ
jgi:hypothetical protein